MGRIFWWINSCYFSVLLLLASLWTTWVPRYELCSYPPSLFDSSLMLLKPQKPALADAIWASFFQIQLKYTMSWMVVHSFIGSLGLEDSQYIWRSVTCIVSMWQGSVVLQLSSLMVTSKVPQNIWHTRSELENKPRHLSHSRMVWDWPWRETTSCVIQATSNPSTICWAGIFGRLPNTSLTSRCWSSNSSDSCGKRKKGEHCSRGGRHWSPYFTVLLHRNERWRIIFSA